MDAVLVYYKAVCLPLVVWRGWGKSGNSSVTILAQEPRRERMQTSQLRLSVQSNLTEKCRFIFAFIILN
jgi:hypothetical protein